MLETVEDLVEEFGDQPEMLRKMLFLRDCTSPVVHPEIDFRAIAAARLAEFEQMGIQLVDSSAVDLGGSRLTRWAHDAKLNQLSEST